MSYGTHHVMFAGLSLALPRPRRLRLVLQMLAVPRGNVHHLVADRGDIVLRLGPGRLVDGHWLQLCRRQHAHGLERGGRKLVHEQRDAASGAHLYIYRYIYIYIYIYMYIDICIMI